MKRAALAVSLVLWAASIALAAWEVIVEPMPLPGVGFIGFLGFMFIAAMIHEDIAIDDALSFNDRFQKDLRGRLDALNRRHVRETTAKRAETVTP